MSPVAAGKYLGGIEYGNGFRSDLRKNIFTLRVFRVWKSMLQSVVKGGIRTAFEKHIDEYFKRHSYTRDGHIAS